MRELGLVSCIILLVYMRFWLEGGSVLTPCLQHCPLAPELQGEEVIWHNPD
jgi:hypothetical protein